MTEPTRRPSRRQILKTMATLPFVSLASVALANPSRENVDALLEAASSLPPEDRTWILSRAKADHSLNDAQLLVYEAAVVSLWEHFIVGLEQGGKGRVDPAPNLARDAYNKVSGEKVAAAVKAREYPQDGNHATTNVCAYLCGLEAADLAEFGDEPWVVDKSVYELAWTRTKKTMGPKLEAIRRIIAKRAEREVPATLGTGLGC